MIDFQVLSSLVLLNKLKRFIAGDPEQIEVKLDHTHADIAKLTATIRQMVSALLNDLEKQGIIKYDRSRIYIKDLSLL